MKIVFSSFDDMKNPYYGGGGAFSVHEVAKRLATKHQVTILTGIYPGSKDETVDGVFYKRISYFGSLPKLCQGLFLLCLPFYIRKLDFDIWFESFTPPFSTAFLPWFTKKRVVGVTHLLGGKEMSKRYKLPFYLVENFGLKQYKEIIVLNDSLKKQVEESNQNCLVSIIPNGEEKELIDRPNNDREELYILFIGRLDINHKGLDYLLDIYKNVLNKIDINLLIAGGGMPKDVDYLKNRINELGLATRVKMVGKVMGKEKEEVFKKAKLLVMSSRIEAFPRVLLEAFCYEVPTILFNIEELSWIPDNIVIKVKPFDTEEFSEKLIILDTDKDLRQQLAKNGKLFVKEFNWDKISEQYEELIFQP